MESEHNINYWQNGSYAGYGAGAFSYLEGRRFGNERRLERYQELTGLDTSQIDYYRAFQYWRMGAIVEGVLSRYLKGVMGNPADTDAFRRQVDAVAEAALERVRKLDA